MFNFVQSFLLMFFLSLPLYGVEKSCSETALAIIDSSKSIAKLEDHSINKKLIDEIVNDLEISGNNVTALDRANFEVAIELSPLLEKDIVANALAEELVHRGYFGAKEVNNIINGFELLNIEEQIDIVDSVVLRLLGGIDSEVTIERLSALRYEAKQLNIAEDEYALFLKRWHKITDFNNVRLAILLNLRNNSNDIALKTSKYRKTWKKLLKAAGRIQTFSLNPKPIRKKVKDVKQIWIGAAEVYDTYEVSSFIANLNAKQIEYFITYELPYFSLENLQGIMKQLKNKVEKNVIHQELVDSLIRQKEFLFKLKKLRHQNALKSVDLQEFKEELELLKKLVDKKKSSYDELQKLEKYMIKKLYDHHRVEVKVTHLTREIKNKLPLDSQEFVTIVKAISSKIDKYWSLENKRRLITNLRTISFKVDLDDESISKTRAVLKEIVESFDHSNESELFQECLFQIDGEWGMGITPTQKIVELEKQISIQRAEIKTDTENIEMEVKDILSEIERGLKLELDE